MLSFSNPFFDHAEEIRDSNAIERNSPYDWFISADKIFASDFNGMKDYARFLGMKFRITRFSLFDKVQVSDSAVAAENVTVYMHPGRHCAMLQGRMAKGVVIPKIIMKKASIIRGALSILEVKEFSKCVIQSFERVGELVSFCFRYASYSDSYTDYSDDGKKIGTAATQIDLTEWKVKDS